MTLPRKVNTIGENSIKIHNVTEIIESQMRSRKLPQ